jgi:hypothetical protein
LWRYRIVEVLDCGGTGLWLQMMAHLVMIPVVMVPATKVYGYAVSFFSSVFPVF